MNSSNVAQKWTYRLIGVSLILCLTCSSVSADIVYLNNGGKLEGTITDQGDRFLVEHRGGSMIVNKSQIVRVEEKPLAENIFPALLRDAKGNADACVEAARWALKNNLEKEYVQGLRSALLYDKNHRMARKLLREYRIYHSHLPYNETAGNNLLYDMGTGFSILRTEHYLICYNSTNAFADLTGQRLEKLYQEFMIFFEDRRFEPAPLTKRIEVVLFDSPTDFKKFALEISPGMAISKGFYLSKNDRSYFFDSISDANPQFLQTKKQLRLEYQKIDDFRTQVLNNSGNLQYVFRDDNGLESRLNKPQALQRLKQQEEQLRDQEDKLLDFYRSQNVGVTMHEGTHQLAYLCGIHSRYFNNPKWMVEGLAMYFESMGEARHDRPGQINQQRLKLFYDSASRGPVIPLKELILNDELLDPDSGCSRAAYANSWALFYYLVQQKHKKLFDYIYDLSLRITDKPYTPEQRIADFEKYFGNISSLERPWRLYVYALPKDF